MVFLRLSFYDKDKLDNFIKELKKFKVDFTDYTEDYTLDITNVIRYSYRHNRNNFRIEVINNFDEVVDFNINDNEIAEREIFIR